MNAPRRLLDDHGAELGAWSDPGSADLARSLLASGRDVDPPPMAAGAVWASLEAAILVPPGGPAGGGSGGAAPTGGATSTGASGSASVGGASSAGGATAAVGGSSTTAVVGGKGLLLAVKLGVATLVTSGAVATAVIATRPSSVELAPVDAAGTASLVETSSSASTGEGSPTAMLFAPARTEAAALPEPSTAAHALPAVGASEIRPSSAKQSEPVPTSTPAERAAELKTEAEGVQRARAQLSAGDPSGALATLGELDRSVPRGVLGQERALYAILALSAAGQHERASRQAEAFLRTWPTSPHADRVRGMVQR